MKRLGLIILIVLLLSGCCTRKNSSLSLECYQSGEGLIEIDQKKLKDLEQEKKSFALFIYMPHCTTSALFKEVLTTFLAEEQLSFYAITGSALGDCEVNECIQYYPTIAIYQDGHVVSYLKADSETDLPYYEESESFREWFYQNVSL